MVQPLRIEFPGTVYHVTSRGDRRESVFEDDTDREAQLCVVAQGVERFDVSALIRQCANSKAMQNGRRDRCLREQKIGHAASIL